MRQFIIKYKMFFFLMLILKKFSEEPVFRPLDGAGLMYFSQGGVSLL